jgi:hypothetical protein
MTRPLGKAYQGADIPYDGKYERLDGKLDSAIEEHVDGSDLNDACAAGGGHDVKR